MLDPIGGGVGLVIGLIRTHKLNEWAKLCFAMTWSYMTAFSFATGSALVAQQPLLVAVGSGMVVGASVVCFLFARSPLTKDLMVSVPRDLIVGAEGKQELVTIERKK
jgi:hypothetical protein